ncbi:hypothetical protein FQZ97_1024910 [compost metagenome]
MPNQMANSSGGRPKSSAVTMGKNTGMVSRIMDSESMKQPSTTYSNKIAISTRMGLTPQPDTMLAASCGSCDKARKVLYRPAPSTIMKIMPVAIAVPSTAPSRVLRLRPPLNQAERPVPNAPMAAPSVGVNRPV